MFKILLPLFLLALSAYAAQTPEELIQDIFAKTAKENLLNNLEVKKEIDNHVDFKEMSKAILRQELNKINANEFAWFNETLQEIITRTVYPEAPKFLENVKISYEQTSISENEAKISSSVYKKGERTDINYFLKKTNNDNEWRIVDIAIDDESWVKTINSKVNKTIKEKGWPGLKKMLNKKLSELKTGKKLNAKN